MFLRKPLFFLDNDPSGGGNEEPKGDPNPDPASDDDSPAWAEEKDKLLKAHNKANKEARELRKQVESLTAKLQKLEESNPENGDPAKLREKFQSREKELTDQIDALTGKLNESKKRGAFDKLAPNLFVDKSIEQVWKLVGPDLELDDSGNVIFKDSHRSFADDLKRFADENDYFAKNPGKAGTGANGAGTQKGGKATSVPADLRMWSKDRQSEWMKENPELAAEAAAKALGG